MKRKFNILILLLSLATAIFTFLGCKSMSVVDYPEFYTANYGEWFVLPEADSIEVYYANGEKADISSNRVFIDDASDYKIIIKQGKQEAEILLKVNKNVEPKIYASQDVVFGVINKKVELPMVTAHDGVTPISVSGKVLQNGTEIDITEGFVPTSVGEYTYVVAATNGANFTAEKQLPVYIENTENDVKDRVASFDKPYGVNHFENHAGGIVYSTEVRFEDEAGSTGYQFGKGLVNELPLCNLQIEDVSDYDEIYFYVYNDSDVSVAFSLNWTKPYSYIKLRSRVWTEIAIETTIFDNLKMSANMVGSFSSKNIKGTPFLIECSDMLHAKFYDTVYFSSIRGMNYMDAETLNAKIEESSETEEISLREITLIEQSYEALSEEEKQSVLGYDVFETLKISKIMQENGITAKDDKVIYLDNQKAIDLQVGPTSWTNATLTVTDEKQYNEENVAKTTAKKGAIEIAFSIQEQFISDLTEYDFVTFGVYVESADNLVYYNGSSEHIGTEANSYSLKNNEWNTLTFTLGELKSIEGSTFWIIAEGWEKFTDNVTVYISSFYALKTPTNELLFGESLGVGQLAMPVGDSFPRDASITYTTDKAYGNESGSIQLTTSITSKHNALYVNVVNADEKATANTLYTMYVYYEGTSEEYLYFAFKDTWTVVARTKLVSGEWTRVDFILPVGEALSDYAILVMKSDWLFEKGDIVYLSSLKRQDEINMELPLDEVTDNNYLTAVKTESNVSISHSNDIKIDETHSGSTKISASKALKAQLRVDITKYAYYMKAVENDVVFKFNVYNESVEDWKISFMLDGTWESEQSQTLNASGWTEVTFTLKAGKCLSDYEILFNNISWDMSQGDCVYISPIVISE